MEQYIQEYESFAENNEFIAEFMGAKVGDIGCLGEQKQEELNYHKSWNRLMVVAEKLS